MSNTDYDSRTADKFVVRLPDGLRAEIDSAATADDRSMNSVFVRAVRQYLDGQRRQQILLNVLANTVAAQIPAEPFNIDTHVHMIVDSRRYQWLRDRNRVTDIDTDLCVARDDTVFFGLDLDKTVDDAMRLAHLEELHP